MAIYLCLSLHLDLNFYELRQGIVTKSKYLGVVGGNGQCTQNYLD